MSYKRISFGQYYTDQSLGRGGEVSIEVNYKKVEYKGKFLKHDAFYCVLFNEARDVYQIYFKETCTTSQWISNFLFAKKYYDSFQYKGKDIQLKAARGWSDLYCALKWYIRDDLSALIKDYGKKPVEIIGWSLGSAIAQLCAQDLYFNYKIQSYVYTYGSVKPWAGHNKDMKAYLADCTKACYNFRNREDIVGYMVPLPSRFAINHIKLKATDKKITWIFCLFKPQLYHTNYYKNDLYINIE